MFWGLREGYLPQWIVRRCGAKDFFFQAVVQSTEHLPPLDSGILPLG